jgi:hypothetical protein
MNLTITQDSESFPQLSSDYNKQLYKLGRPKLISLVIWKHLTEWKKKETSQKMFKKDDKFYNRTYSNFIAEGHQNIEKYNALVGKSLKYGDTFQLYQDSTKRYLCLKNWSYLSKSDIAEEDIKELFVCGFSDYPNEFTHFEFFSWSESQRKEDESIIKNYHDLNLLSIVESKMYFYTSKGFGYFWEEARSKLNWQILNNENGSELSKANENMEQVMIHSGYLNKSISRFQGSNVTGKRSLIKEKEYIIDLKNNQNPSQLDWNSIWSLMYNYDTHEFKIWDFAEQSQCFTVSTQRGDASLIQSDFQSSDSSFQFITNKRIPLSPLTLNNKTMFLIQETKSGKYLKTSDLLAQKTSNSDANKNNFLILGDKEKEYDNPWLFTLFNLGYGQKSELKFVVQAGYYFEFAYENDSDSSIIYEHRNEIAKVIHMIYLYVRNEIPGKIRPGYPKGKVISYR